MVHKELIKRSLRGKRPMFLQIGFVVMVLFVYMVSQPVKAQEIKSDTTKQEEDFIIYTPVEKNAGFPGGDEARVKFLLENIKYPREAIEKNWQGRVVVVFVVEIDGSLTNIEIGRSSGHSVLDEEAIRVVKLMPKWEPSEMYRKAIRTKYSMPIPFTLYDGKSEEKPIEEE